MWQMGFTVWHSHLDSNNGSCQILSIQHTISFCEVDTIIIILSFPGGEKWNLEKLSDVIMVTQPRVAEVG